MEKIESSSLVDVAASRLRAAILSGDLSPGAPLRVGELQAWLGVSHIPIREALRQLETEGLIVPNARRTRVVADVNLSDVKDVYELRRLVELPTVAAARRVGTAADGARIREALEQFRRVSDDPPTAEYWARHADFHWALLEAGANSWTKRLLEPLWTATERYVRLFVATYATASETLDLHVELLNAYEDDDESRIVSELDRHFEVTERGVREGLARRIKSTR